VQTTGLPFQRRASFFPHIIMYGHELLKTIETLHGEGKSAAMLRHAARFPIVDPTEPTLAEITPEGETAAEDFGRHIAGFECVRLFHSPVKRCRQTAECIARGAENAGLTVEHLGPETALGVDYILDLTEAGRLTALHGDHFVRLWHDGQIEPTVIHATKQIAETKLDYLARKLQEPCLAGRRLDLHVSHDWNILALRELLLGVSHEEAGWLNFLDGLAFSLCAGRLEARYRSYARAQTLPWRFL
jgi:broad specificity phosphatase PhoE